jgi:hypothetical protein
MRSVVMRVVVILAAVVLLLIGAFVAWGSTPLAPLPEAEQALLSDAAVRYSRGAGWCLNQPTARQTRADFLPGWARGLSFLCPPGTRIAAQRLPRDCGTDAAQPGGVGANLASEVISAYPDIQHWAIGGHSLGGAMAALFAEQNPDAVQGLVLWAAYPAENNSLADSGLAVVSIYATEDGLATSGKIDASQSLLPPGTRYVAIPGGNHAQFGWYGEQAGDGQASISPDQQQQQVVTATESLLQELKGN